MPTGSHSISFHWKGGVKSSSFTLRCSPGIGSRCARFYLLLAPLSDIINLHGLNHTIYADDTHVYLLFDSRNRDSQYGSPPRLIKDIKAWAVQNKMKFNDAKTEIMHFQSSFTTSSPPSTLTIGDSSVSLTREARTLGHTPRPLEDTLSMEKHTSNVCRASWACIRRIGHLRKYLDVGCSSNRKTRSRVHHVEN